MCPPDTNVYHGLMTGTERETVLRVHAEHGQIFDIPLTMVRGGSAGLDRESGCLTVTLMTRHVEITAIEYHEPKTTQAEPATVGPVSDLPYWCNKCQARYAGPLCPVIGHEGDLLLWADPYDQNRPLSDFPFWCERCGRARASASCGLCRTANRARRV